MLLKTKPRRKGLQRWPREQSIKSSACQITLCGISTPMRSLGTGSSTNMFNQGHERSLQNTNCCTKCCSGRLVLSLTNKILEVVQTHRPSREYEDMHEKFEPPASGRPVQQFGSYDGLRGCPRWAGVYDCLFSQWLDRRRGNGRVVAARA